MPKLKKCLPHAGQDSAEKGDVIVGFFDSLFGGGQKEAPKPAAKPKKKKVAPVEENEAAVPQEEGLTPEVVAAISASINTILADDADPAVMAAIVAAIAHAQHGSLAVKFRRTNNVWAATGRQKIMDSRQVF